MIALEKQFTYINNRVTNNYHHEKGAIMNEVQGKKEYMEVTGDELNYILGNPKKHTWSEFYETLEQERTGNIPGCPQSCLIAMELLTPSIMKMPWRGPKTNSETYQDVLSESYLVIASHIDDFDRTQSSFRTYISKWLTGLAREIRNDGISKYQQEKFGCRVYSTDALVAKDTMDDNSEMVFEFPDEDSAVENVYEKKEKERSNALLRQMMQTGEEVNNEASKKNVYVNVACYQLFLGGIENMPDAMKEELEELTYA